ncbi:gametogenetin-binding protein 1-like [Rhynchocyon petersi]
MAGPAPTHPSRILGRSSMFRFFRSLMRSKSRPKRSDKGPARGQGCSSKEQDAVALMMGRQDLVERKEPGVPSSPLDTPEVAIPKGSLQDPTSLEMGDTWAQALTPLEMLQVLAQGKDVKSDVPRENQKVLDNLTEEEEEEEAAYRDSSASSGSPFVQALEVEQELLQRAVGPQEVSPKSSTKEQEEGLLDRNTGSLQGRGHLHTILRNHCLFAGELKVASSKAATPWSYLLSLCRLQKSSRTKEGLACGKEKGEEEEVGEEDSAFNLCVPGVVTLQSPLHKTFRSTDTVGFVESELKKLLAVQRESRLWKMGGIEGRELLAQPEITLEEAGIVYGQHLLLEEMDEMGNWPPE